MSESRERLARPNEETLLAHYRGICRTIEGCYSRDPAKRARSRAWLDAGVPFLADALAAVLEIPKSEDEPS